MKDPLRRDNSAEDNARFGTAVLVLLLLGSAVLVAALVTAVILLTRT